MPKRAKPPAKPGRRGVPKPSAKSQGAAAGAARAMVRLRERLRSHDIVVVSSGLDEEFELMLMAAVEEGFAPIPGTDIRAVPLARGGIMHVAYLKRIMIGELPPETPAAWAQQGDDESGGARASSVARAPSASSGERVKKDGANDLVGYG